MMRFDELRRHFARIGVTQRNVTAAVRWARRLRVAQEELRDGKTESLTAFAKRHGLA